MSTNMF